ncbi:MAG: carboxypeptidase regulatory-like domain-containing protein [Bryobacteraceae bacterium]|nr:carboxypeptidase regulatory-like domain-containing protein [Bryobacteraceae bacterium]
MKLSLRLLCGLLCTLCLLFGQADANKGQIIGSVFDAKQAAVPGATVKVKNVRTGLTRELKTNEEGQYRAVQLDAGEYEIVAQSSGFAPATLQGITLNVGSSINIDITLQVQATTTTVEVADTLLSVALPAPASVVNSTAITNLPINGRRFQEFATLTPTVQVDPQRQQLSFAGQRGINANVMLDGADYNQPFFGGLRGGERSNFSFTVPQGAIQEFQVITTGYSAEYGRSSGGMLNAITKSGTNEIHGEAFYLLRHKELGRVNPFGFQSLETQHQFGGNAGGPIKRDKLFWFAAVERQDSDTPRRVFIPAVAGIAETDANREALRFIRGLEEGYTQTNKATAVTGKLDWNFRLADRLSFRYNWKRSTEENAVSVGGSLVPTTNRALSNDGVEENNINLGGVQYTALLSPVAVNDFRFTYTEEDRPRLANAVLPEVSLGGANVTWGSRNFLPTYQIDRRLQLTDSFSYIRGQHTFKFGFDFNRITAPQTFGFNQFGGFFFQIADINQLLEILTPGGTTANRFDSTTARYRRAIGNLEADIYTNQFAAFVQDSWRVNRQLTLDFGFRWEGQDNVSGDGTNTAVVNAIRAVSFPNGQRFDPTKIADSMKQFMPRFGFTYAPFQEASKLVVRGHTGIFYATTPLILLAAASNNFRLPAGDVSLEIGTQPGPTVYQAFRGAGIDLNNFTLGNLPILTVEQAVAAANFGRTGAVDPFFRANFTGNAPDYVNPRSFQVGLGFDSEIFKNFVAGVQVNYVNTVHLQRNRDYNLPAPRVAATDRSLRPSYAAAVAGARPIPSVNILTVRETSARSMFRGITFQGQYRRNRLQLNGFYTLSDNYSDDDNERDAGGMGGPDPFNYSRDYNYSRLDVRHQFTANAVYSLPWGFEVAGIVRAYSGRPINATVGSDANGDGQNNDRPFEAPGVVFERNAFRNRSTVFNDFRVLKSFGLGERRRIQFSAEFFNLFDLDNVIYSDGTNIFDQRYGLGVDANGNTVAPRAQWLRLRGSDGKYDPQNQQVGTPLQVQFGLRFFF